MYKHLLIITLVAFILISCNKPAETPKQDAPKAKIYLVGDLSKNEFEYKSGDTVTVDGLCIHVCKHSGKKLFVIGKDENEKLQVFTTEAIPAFDMKLNGSKLRLVGTLDEERIDAKYIAEMENELKEEAKENKESCPTEENMKEVNDLKARLASSKKGYISIYSMNCLKVNNI